MHHTHYRGCWHVFSRCFLVRYDSSSLLIEFTYRNTSAHAASPHQVSIASIPTAAPVGVSGHISSQCGRSPSLRRLLIAALWPLLLLIDNQMHHLYTTDFSHWIMQSCAHAVLAVVSITVVLCMRRRYHALPPVRHSTSQNFIPEAHQKFRSTCMC